MTGIRRPDDGVPSDEPADAGHELDQWLAELRTELAGRERSRRRALAQSAAEEATILGAFADLAERQEPVVIEVDGDRLLRGIVRLAGSDVVVLRDGQIETVIRLDAVASVRLRPDQRLDHTGPVGRPGDSPALAHRPTPAEGTVDFARVLAALAERAPMVTVHRRGTRTALSGALTSVGEDVAVVHASPGGMTYVPLRSVVDVSVTGSG